MSLIYVFVHRRCHDDIFKMLVGRNKIYREENI
jgi:hypothetical protein